MNSDEEKIAKLVVHARKDIAALKVAGIVISCLLLLVLVALIILTLLKSGEVREEQGKEYLIVALASDGNLAASETDLVSVAVSGGVVYVRPQESLPGDSMKQPRKQGNPLDEISSVLKYLGMFGWELDDVEEGAYYFHR